MMDHSETIAVLGAADVETLAEVICLGSYGDGLRVELESRSNPTYWQSLQEETREGYRRAARAVVSRFGIKPATQAQSDASDAITLAYKARSFARWLRAGNAQDVRPEASDYDELAGMIESLALRSAPGVFTSAPSVSAEEIERYVAKCRELATDGQYQWWVRLADILEAMRPEAAVGGTDRS